MKAEKKKRRSMIEVFAWNDPYSRTNKGKRHPLSVACSQFRFISAYKHFLANLKIKPHRGLVLHTMPKNFYCQECLEDNLDLKNVTNTHIKVCTTLIMRASFFVNSYKYNLSCLEILGRLLRTQCRDGPLQNSQ